MQLLTRLIGITHMHTAALNTIYIYIYIKVGRRGFLLQLVFGLDDQIGLWQFKPQGAQYQHQFLDKKTHGSNLMLTIAIYDQK